MEGPKRRIRFSIKDPFDDIRGSFLQEGRIRMSLPFHIEMLSKSHAPMLLDYCLRNRSFLEPFEPLRDEDYFTLEHQSEVIKQSLLQCQTDQAYTFGLFSKEQDKLIGRVNLSGVSRGVIQCAYLGYSLDQEYNGKGWMTQAVQWVTRFGFSSLLLHRIQAAVMPNNAASIRVLKKSGYHQEGLARKYLKINGVWEDHLLFAVIAEEWNDKTREVSQ